MRGGDEEMSHARQSRTHDDYTDVNGEEGDQRADGAYFTDDVHGKDTCHECTDEP